MNYFNYFTEIEEEFVKRRGSHMLVSPLDWSLIETWKQRGVPLHIVLRGINSSFDGYDQRLSRGRKVNSLFFCQQEVEAGFREYVESRVGSNGAQEVEDVASSNGDGGLQFAPAMIIESLKERCAWLRHPAAKPSPDVTLRDTFARVSERLAQLIEDLEENGVVSPELLEIDLMMIEEVILDGLKEHAGPDALNRLRKEGDEKLRGYKPNMEREVYEQTVNNFVARRLREQYQVPRLSLFYL
jgi:hypothetical protein